LWCGPGLKNRLRARLYDDHILFGNPTSFRDPQRSSPVILPRKCERRIGSGGIIRVTSPPHRDFLPVLVSSWLLLGDPTEICRVTFPRIVGDGAWNFEARNFSRDNLSKPRQTAYMSSADRRQTPVAMAIKRLLIGNVWDDPAVCQGATGGIDVGISTFVGCVNASRTSWREAAGRYDRLCRYGREDCNWRDRGAWESSLGTGSQRESWRCGSRQEFDSRGEKGHRQASGGG
jgi:hypothetical protein